MPGKLLTGIPRSGTTLCCKLLNARPDTVALHEPINPATWPANFTSEQACHTITAAVYDFAEAIEQGRAIPHGDKGGLHIDNPVGDAESGGLRQVIAERGAITLPKRQAGSYQLVVKQNALFTALLEQLQTQFDVVCVVRNPVDVLLSWYTVNLPVNRGRIPAGERFDSELRQRLDNQGPIQRQVTIYQWFLAKFINSGLPVVRYEDVIDTAGQVLDEALQLPVIVRDAMQPKSRHFSAHDRTHIDSLKQLLLAMDYGGLYSKEDILNAFDALHIAS